MSHSSATIRAAYNLTIELEPGRWRLFNGVADPAMPDTLRALLEARPEGIACAPTFARARRLPDDGRLAPSDVARVVVGWAPETRNWHLGLMLHPAADGPDRLRWCGLAHWPAGQTGEHEQQAAEAGRALAEVLGRPFHVVPPVPSAGTQVSAAVAPAPPDLPEMAADATARRPAPPVIAPGIGPVAAPERDATALSASVADELTAAPSSPLTATPVIAPPPAVPSVALRTPPFGFEGWRMIVTRRGYAFQRPPRWVIGLMLRAGGYTVGALLFVMLGLGSLESGLAQVNPDWLPYVGIGVGAVLGVLALVTWWRVLTVADVVIDTERREVRRRNRFSGIVRWRVPFASVEYVVLTQTPARGRGRKRADRPVMIWFDGWLHLYDGRRFWTVAELGRIEGRSHAWPLVERLQKQRGRRALHLAHYDSPAHHAAQVIAGALGVSAWVDIR